MIPEPNRLFDSVAGLEALTGEEVGRSTWVTLDQDRVDRFAAATNDPYFIHTDPERAARETPFGGTIVHGLLTLSLLPSFCYEIYDIRTRRMSLNYGYDRVRFLSPVPVGSRVRGVMVLDAVEREGDGRVRVSATMTVEVEGAEKPACVARFIALHFVEE